MGCEEAGGDSEFEGDIASFRWVKRLGKWNHISELLRYLFKNPHVMNDVRELQGRIHAFFKKVSQQFASRRENYLTGVNHS